ncbi:hypothetical protein KAH55_02330 [bacterium]|nr:hypothetical protein [bacterium]
MVYLKKYGHLVLIYIFIFSVSLGAAESGSLFGSETMTLQTYFSTLNLASGQESTSLPGLFQKGPKSPGKAFLFSVLVPGSGEIYAKSYLRGGLFLALEATVWVLYSQFNRKGDDIKVEFKAYADEHWNREKYEIWIEQHPEISQTHGLPETKTQQYFEMIGKYDQFYAGWDDSDNYVYHVTPSPNRLYYMGRRGDSNDEFDKATLMASMAIVNHVVSGIDAILAAKGYNKKHAGPVRTSFRAGTIQNMSGEYPALTLNLRW